MKKLSKKAKNALCLGTLCSIAYLAVYIARNVLSAVTPQMTDPVTGGYSNEFIGKISSTYLIFYAVGQLINGSIGDKIKAKYMISLGLALGGVTNFLFLVLKDIPLGATIAYAMTGFFLAMVYGPMTKVVSESVEPLYATRTNMGYVFASFLGSPIAGVLAASIVWQSVFVVSSISLIVMALVVFFFFVAFEKHGIVKYKEHKKENIKVNGSVKGLIKHGIIKFSLVSIITGIVRTSVVFWMPQYFAQYIGFSASDSAMIFTVTTFVMSFVTFIAIFVYEKLNYRMNFTVLLMFSLSVILFLATYFVKPQFAIVNIILLTLAVMASKGAATMLYSVYCPRLRDTGKVSSITGFLDCLSYVGAAIANTFFANSVDTIGWGNLILVWAGIVFVGVLVALPYGKIFKNEPFDKPFTPLTNENEEKNQGQSDN